MDPKYNIYILAFQIQDWKNFTCWLGCFEEKLKKLFNIYKQMGDERLLAPMAVFSPCLLSKSEKSIRAPLKIPPYSVDDPFDDMFVQQSQIRGPGAGSENVRKLRL